MISRLNHIFIRCLCILLFYSFYFCSDSFASKNKDIPTQRPYIIQKHKYYPLPSAEGYRETGIASWYGRKFHGHTTSNGEKYNMYDISAAHKTLPMHTMLLVKNQDNGKQIVVRVNDRGPFVRGRIIDLSYGAAKKVGIVKSGTARVEIIALGEVKNDSTTGKRQFKKHADLRKGEYFVQIGAFRKEKNGRGLQKRFLDAGFHTVIKTSNIKKEAFYCVWVYVGQTLHMARRSEKALLSKGYKGAFIIAR